MAILCGAALGLEREVHEKPAGLRTTMLICLGAALYAMCGELLQPGEGMPLDRGRIPAQVVAGIGFLGAGVILHYGGTVRGLTTAALIWVSAAIGVVIGIGYPLTGLGLTGTVIVALVALGWIEKITWSARSNTKRKTANDGASSDPCFSGGDVGGGVRPRSGAESGHGRRVLARRPGKNLPHPRRVENTKRLRPNNRRRPLRPRRCRPRAPDGSHLLPRRVVTVLQYPARAVGRTRRRISQTRFPDPRRQPGSSGKAEGERRKE
ncbi:MAG: MgtC/SapB family protein [Deltaproteobacteria bacterium]|nr:MgtC/SapB family protein [Deltaproteobacteria bacterium]